MKKNHLIILITSLLIFSGVILSAISAIGEFSISLVANSERYLLLDNSNQYVSGGTNAILTASKQYSVAFDYTDANKYSNGHVSLSNGGTLVNHDQITSIESVLVKYSGTGSLKAKTSYAISDYGEYFDIVSNHNYLFGSNPYFISFLADGGSVNIESIKINYSCLANPSAEPKTGESNYQLVKSKSDIKTGDTVYIIGQDLSSTSSSTSKLASLTASASTSASYYIKGAKVTATDGIIESGGTPWNVTISDDSYIFTNDGVELNSVIESSKHYDICLGSTAGSSPLWTWSIDDASNGRGYLKGTSTDVYLCYTSYHGTFRGNNSSKWGSSDNYAIYLYKKVDQKTYDVPKDCIGFVADDLNKDSYSVSSVYEDDNAISVIANYSDGTSEVVSSTSYTYFVSTDASGVNKIDESLPFTNKGIYYVTINYNGLIPTIIQLNVGTVVNDLSSSMSNNVYTTADTICLTGNLVASLHYDDGSVIEVKYADFAKYDISATLLDPSGVSHSLTEMFGTSGTWKVKVVYETFVSSVDVTVNAIPVTSISLDKESYAMYVGDVVELVATINPQTATDKSVTWSSSSTLLASVEDGVVTAIGEGVVIITATSNNGLSASCTLTISAVKVSGITLDKTSLTIDIGESQTLLASVLPDNATNKNVTWKSSNTAVASVSDGVVTGVKAGEATITVTSVDGAKVATCSVVVNEKSIDKWTILIYICGANLESDSGLATGDLKEIASVSGQPDDVNIVVEAGGASSWSSTYSSVINKKYLNRFHLENNSYVKDEQISKANMGLSSTFQSFLTWGMETYPAQKTGVILWNHGGGMYGVCYDENYSDDSLSNSEVNAAIANTMTSLKRSDKLEFIGYDACLMAVQDIAEFNSKYFNYMVSSEESESGYGWDYDTWVDDLFAKKDTTVILKAIVDGFIDENGGTSSSRNDQTLSVLDLNYMDAYLEAFEDMAEQLCSSLTSSSKSSFVKVIKSAKYYADTDYKYYCMFDALDVINKLSSSSFNPGSSYIDAAVEAYNDVIYYASCGKGAGNSNGMALFFVFANDYASYAKDSSVYGTSQTNFTYWRSLQTIVGYLS